MYKMTLVALGSADLVDARGIHTMRYDTYPRVRDVRVVPLDVLRRDGFTVPETAPRLVVRLKDRKLTAIEVGGTACLSLAIGGATYQVGASVKKEWLSERPSFVPQPVRRLNVFRPSVPVPPRMVAAE